MPAGQRVPGKGPEEVVATASGHGRAIPLAAVASFYQPRSASTLPPVDPEIEGQYTDFPPLHSRR